MVHRHMAAYQLFYMSSMLIQKARGGHELCHIHISLYACACIYEYQTWMSHKYGHVIHNGAVEVSHLDVICGARDVTNHIVIYIEYLIIFPYLYP